MTANLQSMVDHASSGHKCHVFVSRRCPFLGRPLLSHVRVLKGHRCDACGLTPIDGVRYKCATCDDYDLCQECKGDNRHPREHEMAAESCLSVFYYNQEHSSWNRL